MYRYALLHYVKDIMRDEKEPVGIAVWSPSTGRHLLRFPQPGQRVSGIGGRSGGAIVEAVRDEMQRWIEDCELPYYPELNDPSTDEWWEAVSDLLHHSVQMGPTHPMRPRGDVESETEQLFRRLIHTEEAEEPVERIDSRITAALRRGNLHKQFLANQELRGSHGTPVRVKRAYCKGETAAIIDGANLRVGDPFSQVDGLVGRLDRLRANGLRTFAAVAVLNGHDTGTHQEALKRYLSEAMVGRTSLEGSVFDLDTEEDQFVSTLEGYKARVDGAQQPSLMDA
ncbi:MAG: hypothetical protein ACLFU7_04230 [Armatimonadota bacterium]